MNSKMKMEGSRGGHGRPLQERRGGGDNPHKLSPVQMPRMSFNCEVCADEPEEGGGIGGLQTDYNLWLMHLGGIPHQRKVILKYRKCIRYLQPLDDQAYIMVGLPRFWNVVMLNELVNFFTEFGILTELMWEKHGFCYVILHPFSGKQTSSSFKGIDAMMSKTMLGDLPIRLYRKKRISYGVWDKIYDGTIARELEESHKKKLLEEKESNSRENASSTNLVKQADTNSAPFHTKRITNVQQKPIVNNFGDRRHDKENRPLDSSSDTAKPSKDASNLVEADVFNKEAAFGNASLDDNCVKGVVTVQKTSKDPGEDPEAATVEKAGKDHGEGLDSTEEAKPSNDTSNPVEADVLSKESAIENGSVDDNCVKEDSVAVQNANKNPKEDLDSYRTCDSAGATDCVSFLPAIDLPPPFPRSTFPDETSIIVRGGEEAGAEEPTTNSGSEEDTDPAADSEPDYMKYTMYWYRF